MGSVVLLQVILRALSQKMKSCNSSFDSYGMFWGMSAILCPTLMVLLYEDITRVYRVTFDVQQSEYIKYMWPFIFALLMIFCAPVAIYFGVKFNLTTPSVYLLPAKLLCCCSEKRARALVLSLTFWFDLVAANFLVGHGVFVVYAFLVAPFAVAVNVMLLVLTFICLTYIMALVFTVCAFVGSRKCLGAVLTVLLQFMLQCLSLFCLQSSVSAYFLLSVVSLSIQPLNRTVFPCY